MADNIVLSFPQNLLRKCLTVFKQKQDPLKDQQLNDRAFLSATVPLWIVTASVLLMSVLMQIQSHVSTQPECFIYIKESSGEIFAALILRCVYSL